MKPRIRLKGGVWSCASVERGDAVSVAIMKIGYGYSAREAFDDWLNQVWGMVQWA